MMPNHCRLSLILATNSPTAVIFRRGPSIWTQLILWDTSTDTFTEGQWLKGSVYPEKCDLSPDGTKLLYFAGKFSRYGAPDWDKADYAPTWTAISRPPYFTALALWDEAGTVGGGGYFLDDNTVCLRSGTGANVQKDHLPPDGLIVNGDGCNFDPRSSSQIYRKAANGWQRDTNGSVEDLSTAVLGDTQRRDFVDDPPLTLYRHSRDGQYQLRMMMKGHVPERDNPSGTLSYVVQRLTDGTHHAISDTWADWDQQGRLVYAEKGKLFTAQISEDGMQSRLLADFNPNQFTEVPPPAWATEW